MIHVVYLMIIHFTPTLLPAPLTVVFPSGFLPWNRELFISKTHLGSKCLPDWAVGRVSGLGEKNRSLRCGPGVERRAMLASKIDSNPAAPFLSQLTPQMVRGELQRRMLWFVRTGWRRK